MTLLFLKITGWLIAHTPEPLLHFFSWLLGPAVLLIPERRRLVYSNLHHAFPERDASWHRRIAFKSSRRLIETSLMSLASPYISDERILRISTITPELKAMLDQHLRNPARAPLSIGSLHMAYWECNPWIGMFLAKYNLPMGIVFRPLRNKKLNDWVKSSRERHGIKMYSRREGLFEIFRIMRRQGMTTILYDQNAAGSGTLTTLLGRVCSTTEFPGMLAERYNARTIVIYSRRTSFWRVTYEFCDIMQGGSVADVTIALNRYLENILANDDSLCASWLWSHGRWHARYWPQLRFTYWLKKSFLDEDLAARGLTRATMPRKTRFWFRMPDDSTHIAAVPPLLRDLRRSRPDVDMTLLAHERDRATLQPLLDDNTADTFTALPPSPSETRRLFKKLRSAYPDTIVNLNETPSSDSELRLARPPEFFGLERPGQRRPKLTHRYEVPAEFLATNPTQADLWRKLFEHFGLPK